MQSPLLTIIGTMLNEFDSFDKLKVTFDSKVTSEKHFWPVSKLASQRIGMVGMSWLVFHD